MIVVFWLLSEVDRPTVACHQAFEAADLNAALACAEALRQRRGAGEPISQVCIQSELPASVGVAGVADPPVGYSHYKRRLDPSVKLGRPRPGDPLPPETGQAPE